MATRDEMVTELAEELAVDQTAADQAYGLIKLQKAIQRAYTYLVKKAVLEGNRRFTQAVKEFVWSADQLRVTLPAELNQHRWIDAVDYTSGEPGEPMIEGVDYQWHDHNTLQWLRSSTGPQQDRYFRAFYNSSAEELIGAAEPALISPDHHRLIVVIARNQLRSTTDDYLPQSWVGEQSELMMDYMKYVASARPLSQPQKLTSTSEDYQY